MLIQLFIIGILTGILVGLFGIGGGILLFPIMLQYNFTVPQIVAVSLFLNAVPNTIPGLYIYYKQGHFNLKISSIIAVGVVLGSVLGSYLGAYEYIDKHLLYRLYTLILCMLVIFMFVYHW